MFLSHFALAQVNSSDPIDIRDIPRIAPGLGPGTLAWALVSDLRPTQPQVGEDIVQTKKAKFEEKLNKNPRKFSEEFFDYIKRKQVAPIYLIASSRAIA